MRFVVYLALLALAVGSISTSVWNAVLLIAYAKACLVGIEYMELRRAHPLHRNGYVLFVSALVLLLRAIATA